MSQRWNPDDREGYTMSFEQMKSQEDGARATLRLIGNYSRPLFDEHWVSADNFKAIPCPPDHPCPLCDAIHERSLLRKSGWCALLSTRPGKNRVWNALSTAIWATKSDWRQRRRR